jgi:hypothetical protein
MIRVGLVATVAILLIGAGEAPVRLVCSPVASDGGTVALELDEAGGTARMLDPYFLQPIEDPKFVIVYFTPTMISLNESKEDKNLFWLLDRVSGKLSRNSPRTEYYCSQGRRF